MKLFLLATAMIATPVLAQQNTPTNPPQPQGAAPTPGDSPMAGTATMPSSPPPAGAMAGQADMPGSPPMSGTPVGGYQPSAPALSGPVAPGTTVTYQQAPSPDQAYPAPAPLAKYPMCKPGQFDQCMQGAGSTHSRQVHRRRK